MDEIQYSNIREFLGYLVGQRVVDVTQHEQAEWDETHKSYVMLMFESGDWLKVFVNEDGLTYFNQNLEDDDD